MAGTTAGDHEGNDGVRAETVPVQSTIPLALTKQHELFRALRTFTMASRKSSPRLSLSVAQSPETIRRCVLEIVQGESDISVGLDQMPMSFGRLPMQINMRILPVSYDGTEILLNDGQSDTIDSQTRDLSFDGMSFEHRSPVDERYFAAFFPALDALHQALLFERLWSRKVDPLEYASGGRFVGVVSLQGSGEHAADGQSGKLTCSSK
jgi:hypothetical protein